MLEHLAIGVLIAVLQFFSPITTRADVEIRSHQVEYLFGSQMSIQLEVSDSDLIDQVLVYIQPVHTVKTTVKELEPTEDPSRFIYNHNLKTETFPGFSTLEYWFEITDISGETTQSDHFTIHYTDNRFEWKTLTADQFSVHWYSEDLTFGQRLLNAVQVGDLRVQDYFEITNQDPLEVYAYADQSDMELTLNNNGNSWVIGHANPAIGVIVVTLPSGPEQEWEIDRQIPHEVSHIYLYRKIGDGYYNLPRWFNEGLASINENVINPDYLTLLYRADETNSLIPIDQLCASFPQTSSDFILSYAEAAYLTDFIYSKYGKEGIEAMLASYADGASCDGGVQEALGISLADLETQWKRATFSQASLQMENISGFTPWLVILGMILLIPIIMIIINSAQKPKEENIYGSE